MMVNSPKKSLSKVVQHLFNLGALTTKKSAYTTVERDNSAHFFVNDIFNEIDLGGKNRITFTGTLTISRLQIYNLFVRLRRRHKRQSRDPQRKNLISNFCAHR